MVTVASREDLLKSAAEGIYSLSVGDASSRIAEANAAYGLARMRYVFERRGIDSSRAVNIFTPDGGITRNKERWAAGFGYGCLLRWPGKAEAGRAFAFPEIKPNACGTLVAKLDRTPEVSSIWERLEAAKGRQLTLEGSKLKLNLGVSNHFIEVCRVTRSDLPQLSEGDIIAVMHTSPNELKDELYDYNRWIDRGGRYEKTPFGDLLVLEGEVAEHYYDVYREVERFSISKRLHLTQVIFGDHEVISNATHQGLMEENVAGLGVYRTRESMAEFEAMVSDMNHEIANMRAFGRRIGHRGAFGNVAMLAPPSAYGGDAINGLGLSNIFPLTLRHDLPIYLMRGRANLSPEIIDDLGLTDRLTTQGHLDILKNADLLPHGGGYKLLAEYETMDFTENGSKRFYEFSSKRSKYVFSDPRELPYDYRGKEVLQKIGSLRLGDVVAEADQLYTLKY